MTKLWAPTQAPRLPTHHPAEPQAGLACGSDGDAGGGHVRGGLQGLDDPGGLTEGAGTDDVLLPHSEPGSKADDRSYSAQEEMWKDGNPPTTSKGMGWGGQICVCPCHRGHCSRPLSFHLVSLKMCITYTASFPKSLHRMVNAPQLSNFPFQGKHDWMGYVARI